MPRTCTVCAHDEHHAINVALVQPGASNRRIAAQYGLTEQSVRRHRAEHIPRLLLEAERAVQVADANYLLEKLEGLEADARQALEANRGEDWRVYLSALSELREQIKLFAQVSGKLAEVQINTQVNIALVEHPDYQRLEDAIARALEPYDAARYAVADALGNLEIES